MRKERRSNLQAWFVASLLLLAFALRVHRLEHHNIWGDEAFSIELSKQSLAQIIVPEMETLPPLYHILLHFWMTIAGDSIFAVRYFSVIPGILLISLVHVIGQRLFGRPGATLAAGMTAFSSFAIYYSQETRMYAWVTAFGTLSAYSMLRLQHRSSSKTEWSATYLVSTLAAIFTHYYAWLVLLAQNLFMVTCNNHRWRWLQVITGLSFLPWALAHAAFITSKANLRMDAWGLEGANQVWAGSLWAFATGITVSPQQQWMAAAMLIFVAIGVRHVWQLPGQQRFLALYLFVPITGAWLIGPLMPFFYERYLTIALPAYILLLVAGLLASARPILIGGLLLAMITNLISVYNYYVDPRYSKGRYGDLIAYVEHHALSGDGLLLQNGAQAALYDYYGPTHIPSYNLPPWDDAERKPMLDSVIANHPRVWLLMYGDPIGYDPDHQVKKWISHHAFRTYHGDYVDSSLDLYVQDEILPTIPTEVQFGDLISLTHYGLSDYNLEAGGRVQLVLAWRALTEIDQDYTTFVHLIDANEQAWDMADSQPLGGTHPTTVWKIGETVVDRISLQLDAGAPSGDYLIQIGWYSLGSMQRLPATGSTENVLVDRLVIGPIHVTEP